MRMNIPMSKTRKYIDKYLSTHTMKFLDFSYKSQIYSSLSRSFAVDNLISLNFPKSPLSLI